MDLMLLFFVPVVMVVVQICRVDICINVIRYVVNPLFTVGRLKLSDIVVVDVFNLLDLSVLDVEVLLLLCFTDSPLFRFLNEPVLAVVFHFTFLLLLWMKVGRFNHIHLLFP